MRRVNVKGISGSGKSTFAAELARRLDVPYIELDALHHGPNWTEASAEELTARVREAMDSAPGGWVIDGNYESKLGDTVIGAADTIVWLDLPFWLKARRRATSDAPRGSRNKVELWNGNKETWRNALWSRESLFGWMVRGHFRQRRAVAAAIRGRPALRRLRSVAEARRWLDAQSG